MASFPEILLARDEFGTSRGSDNSTSGTLTDVANSGTSFIRLTAASQLDSIVAGFDGKDLYVANATGGNLVVSDETGATAANRIRTGSGAALTLSANSLIHFKYDGGASRWRMLGFNTQSATPDLSGVLVSDTDGNIITNSTSAILFSG